MKSIFIDPLGKKIKLHHSCWGSHIIRRHPIMKGLRRETETTITQPDFIYQSKIDESTHLYYKKFTHKEWGDYYLMVVVDLADQFVKTAFLVYNFNKGKKLIWP